MVESLKLELLLPPPPPNALNGGTLPSQQQQQLKMLLTSLTIFNRLFSLSLFFSTSLRLSTR